MIAEVAYVAYQLVWAAIFLRLGLVLCAAGAAFMAGCVAYVGWFYGDDAGKVLGFLDRSGSEKRPAVRPSYVPRMATSKESAR